MYMRKIKKTLIKIKVSNFNILIFNALARGL